jgi:hypothetical protein
MSSRIPLVMWRTSFEMQRSAGLVLFASSKIAFEQRVIVEIVPIM